MTGIICKTMGKVCSQGIYEQLTFTTLLANSADDKLVTFFLFSQKIGFDNGDNLHEMSNPVYYFEK